MEWIDDTISDLVGDFLFYDRKSDEDIGVGEIERAVHAGSVTEAQIVETFARCLHRGLTEGRRRGMESESLSLDTETVLRAAYAWRYAVVTPGSGAEHVWQAETALIEAVDQWDANRPHDADGGPTWI